MSDPETLGVYAEQAQHYADVTENVVRDPLLMSFIAALPKGAKVLDLGCGPGIKAGVMAQAGLRVTATDPVPEMIAMAARHPGVNATQGTFDDITGTDTYDGIWANFSLLHAPRADMPRHLGALATALKPGGLFHIALKTGTGAKRDTLGRLYTYYTQAELTGLLENAGLHVTENATGRDKGLDGADADWIALRAYG